MKKTTEPSKFLSRMKLGAGFELDFVKLEEIERDSPRRADTGQSLIARLTCVGKSTTGHLGVGTSALKNWVKS